MKAPDWWPSIVLALGTFRLFRLLSYDDFPPVERLRAKILGEYPPIEEDEEPIYFRPTLAHFVGCPFCLGAWLSLAVYLAWLAWPHATMYAAYPFALSAAVGMIVRKWDG